MGVYLAVFGCVVCVPPQNSASASFVAFTTCTEASRPHLFSRPYPLIALVVRLACLPHGYPNSHQLAPPGPGVARHPCASAV